MTCSVSVRTLCAFVARQGDLDHRYTPSPTSLEGIQGHQQLAQSRGAGFEAEVALEATCEDLTVRGRADGLWRQGPYQAQPKIEEFKTYRGDLARMNPAQQALHRAQVNVYGALLALEMDCEQITTVLVYHNIGNQKSTEVPITYSSEDLIAKLHQYCIAYKAWADQEAAHQAARNQALKQLAFPYPDFRPQQRVLAETVYKAIATQRPLLMEAPTGLGKTLGTLYPSLMAMTYQQLDRLFFLTTRNTGRSLALNALHQIREAQPDQAWPLRILELSAQEQSCEHPDKACHGDSCPLASGFYDRLPEARAEAVQYRSALSQAALRKIALNHQICPYYLGQEMARWCDVIIGDVNHYFDQYALLYALTRLQDWRVTLLIDEAHNLIERVRGMYSQSLYQQTLLRKKRSAPHHLKKPLNRLARQWPELLAVLKDQQASATESSPAPQSPPMSKTSKAPTPIWQDTLPDTLLPALQGVIRALTDHLSDTPDAIDWQSLLFESLSFARLAESFGTHSIIGISKPAQGHGQLNLQNLIPAPFTAPRWSAAHSLILFSATLSPPQWYIDLLGLPEQSVWQSVASPFEADQLQLRLTRRISTRYRDRTQSLAPLCQIIATTFAQQPGQYLAFFSSFSYLDQVADYLTTHYPSLPVRPQSRHMNDAERSAFIQQFDENGQGIGLAVLGGAFAEGIDLPGRRLIGVFIATLGLPPWNDFNERLRQRLEAQFGPGKGQAYTYDYPGLQKVIQAAGRVIRTADDRGIIVLLDDRFTQPRIQQQLPRWWPSDNPILI